MCSSPLRYVFALVPLLFATCAPPPLYVPNSVHAPLHKEEGEVQIGGHLSDAGFEASGAAALTSHLGVMASASLLDPSVFSESDIEAGTYSEGAFIEAGMGYYGTAGTKQSLRYAFYGGYGSGKARAVDVRVNAFDTGPELRVEGTYQRFFVQPSVGIVRETPGVLDVEARLSVRASWVDFRQFSVARPPDSASVARPRPSSPFLEPSLAGGVFGEQGLGLTVRISRVIPLDAAWRTPAEEYADTTRPLIYEPLILSVGLQLRLEDVF